MPAMTRSASSRARRPAAPSTSGARRVRTESRKARSSARSGSSRSDGSVVKSNFGCAPGSTTRTRSASWRVKSTEIYSCCWKNRSLRTRSVETRLAVTLATAPEAKSRRTCAMSTLSVRTGMPIAFISRDGRTHQGEQDIQVVNHDIVHHVNIQAARRENAETMNFKVKWRINNRNHRDDSGIESFQVPDLQNSARPRGCGNKLVRLGKRCGHRFFHDDVDAEFEQAAAEARVLDGGHSHTRCVHSARKRFNVRQNFRGEFLRDLFGAGGIGIHNAGQLCPF